MKCEKCEYFKDVFGNFVQCIKTGRFLDWEYWNNKEPEDCPLDKEENNKGGEQQLLAEISWIKKQLLKAVKIG